ncbi:Hypothetical protein A7982_03689 [Minicystis rosea]|nr:Hypothetical protein A7982_03689 [Minicystis rosea]
MLLRLGFAHVAPRSRGGCPATARAVVAKKTFHAEDRVSLVAPPSGEARCSHRPRRRWRSRRPPRVCRPTSKRSSRRSSCARQHRTSRLRGAPPHRREAWRRARDERGMAAKVRGFRGPRGGTLCGHAAYS